MRQAGAGQDSAGLGGEGVAGCGGEVGGRVGLGVSNKGAGNVCVTLLHETSRVLGR